MAVGSVKAGVLRYGVLWLGRGKESDLRIFEGGEIMKARRIGLNKAKQFAIIPSFGIAWGSYDCKLAIAFVWLNYQFYIRFFRKDFE